MGHRYRYRGQPSASGGAVELRGSNSADRITDGIKGHDSFGDFTYLGASEEFSGGGPIAILDDPQRPERNDREVEQRRVLWIIGILAGIWGLVMIWSRFRW